MKNSILITWAIIGPSLAIPAFPSSAADTNAAPTNLTPLLKIVVVPATNHVHLGVPFPAAFRVENTSRGEVQSVIVMNCSWSDNWKSDNTNLFLEGQQCTRNFPVRLKIAPGQAYTNQGSMEMVHAVPGDKLSFRIGFTPFRSELGSALESTTLWSSNIVLTVTP